MRTLQLTLPTVFALGMTAAILAAPAASALPQCTNTGPNTTQCERPGNAQINTSPNPATADNFPWGWPWWGSTGITIGIGGIGF